LGGKTVRGATGPLILGDPAFLTEWTVRHLGRDRGSGEQSVRKRAGLIPHTIQVCKTISEEN
jgi:hypothetical protein